jgi:hypothetical protein
MKTKLIIGSALAVAAGLAAGCNQNNGGVASNNPPPPTPVSYDSAQVLALAQVASETSSPFSINDGAVSFSDTSETAKPIAVNATN